MQKSSLELFFFSCLLALPFSSGATEYYVSPTGNDTGAGTFADPWRTPQRAADVAGPGDVIILREGVYRPDAPAICMIDFGPGTPAQPIVLKAAPGETAELNGMVDLSDPTRWTFDAQNGVYYVDGLSPTNGPQGEEMSVVVQGDPPNDTALEPVDSLTDVTDRQGATYWDASIDRLYVNPIGGGNPGNNTMQVSQILDEIILFREEDQYIHIGDDEGTLKITGSFYGIRSVPNGGNHVITNVRFRHFREDAVKFNTIGNTGDIVQNCTMSSYGDFGIDSFGSNNQIFKGNRFTGVFPWKSGGAVKLIGGASSIVIDGNIAESLGGTGGEGAFEIREVNDIDIRNNIITNPAGSAILVYAEGGGNVSRNVRIVNNTVYRTGGSAIWITNNSEDVSVYNTIVDNSTATGSNSRALRVDAGGATGFDADFNSFYRPGSSNVVRWLNTNYTLEEYQGVTGLDGSSIAVNPRLVNPGAGNVVPLMDSPVVDAGWDAVAPATDVTGVSRPQSFAADMGAHEVVITESTVAAPNVSEVEKGRQLDIAWRGFTGSSVIIYLYKGSEYLRRVVELTPNDGHFSWTVPGVLEIGDDYRIKVLSAADSSEFDLSDQTFAITGPVPEVTFPGAPGVVLARGQEVDITWTGFTGSTVRIFLFRGAQYDRRIVNPAPNTGSYSWTVPNSLEPRSDYRIEIRSNTDSSQADFSEYSFEVQ